MLVIKIKFFLKLSHKLLKLYENELLCAPAVKFVKVCKDT